MPTKATKATQNEPFVIQNGITAYTRRNEM